MKYVNAQVIGFNTDQEAAQVLITYEGEEHIFLAVVKIVSDDAFVKGRHLLSELSDMFFESSEEGIGQRLAAVFEDAKQKLSDSAESHILLGAISAKVLYLIHKGEINTLLKRQDKVSSLIEDRPQEQLISGFLQEEDRVLFSTQNMIDLLGEDLKQSLSLPLTEWEEVTSNKMSVAETDSQGFACLLIQAQPDPGIERPSVDTEDGVVIPENKFNFGVIVRLLSNIKNIGKLIPRSGKGKLILGILLLLILLGGIGLQYYQNQQAERTKAYLSLLDQSNKDYETALSLQTLNPTETKAKIASAKENVQKAIAIKPSEQQGLDLKRKIEENESLILQQFQASELPVFLDLSTIRGDFRADRLSLMAGKLAILDNSDKSLYIIGMDKKDNTALVGESDLGKAFYASASENFIFVYSLDKGILKIDTSNKKVTKIQDTNAGLGEIVDIGGFGSNVYLLDKTANQVWKYVPAAAGYSSKRPYFVTSVKVDLSNAQRMQIDSSIYILKLDGNILKFTKGAQDTFTISGLDKPLKDPQSLYVSDVTENLYILDTGNSRLVVVSKSGVYKTQYESEKFSAVSDLVVDEKNKKVYLLEINKIYEMMLK